MCYGLHPGYLGRCIDLTIMMVGHPFFSSPLLRMPQASPIHPWSVKYKKKPKPLPPKQIAMVLRQVLEGIEFLRAKGLEYGHLHSGNVIMEGNVPRYVAEPRLYLRLSG